MLIKVKNTREFQRYVPGYVFQQSPFKFVPVGFAIQTAEQSKELLYPSSIQEKGLVSFLDKPFGGQNYVITGHLDDSKALYLSAFLLQAHVIKGGKNPVWITLNSSFKDNLPFTKPSLLVLSNITSESTAVRFEKCRDYIYKYWDIPKIIVGCGMDPIRFGAFKLHIPVTKMIYFKSGLDTETITLE